MAKIRTRKITRRPQSGPARAAGQNRGADAQALPVLEDDAPPAGAADGGRSPGATADPSPGAGVEAQGQADALGAAQDHVLTLDDQTAPGVEESREERIRRVRLENLAKGRVARAAHRREPSAPRPPTGEAPKSPGPKLDAQASRLVMQLVESLAVQNLGEDVRLTTAERNLIEPPLGRIMARMSPQGAAAFAAFADPVLLLTGLFMWGGRLMAAREARKERPVQQPIIRPDFTRQRSEPHVVAPSASAEPTTSIDPDLDAAFGAGHL